MAPNATALRAFVQGHLFASQFRASAQSQVGENASRLATMQPADRDIGELLTEWDARFHCIRWSGIAEELFGVVAGFDAMATPVPPKT